MSIAMVDGSISSLWRYPVKSLLGENMHSLHVNYRGIVNDRAYAISNKEGKFGSGKNTRRFRRIDGLFSMSAASANGGVFISFPDGLVLSNKSPDINSTLSKTLGQEVKLTQETVISHFDDGPIHILTTRSLSKLQSLSHREVIDERRFRANIVINTTLPISDDDLVGKTIKIGEVELKVTHKTERCRMITLEQENLESEPEILRTVSKHYDLNFGVYASVVKTGKISLKDKVGIFEK